MSPVEGCPNVFQAIYGITHGNHQVGWFCWGFDQFELLYMKLNLFYLKKCLVIALGCTSVVNDMLILVTCF